MYYFIVNPHARSGRSKNVWKKVKNRLETEKIPYQVYFTCHQNHASELAARLTGTIKNLTLVVLGGDGTLNEVINGISDFEHTTLGYIPIGSGNDFARGLELPSDPAEALHLILRRPCLQEIDLWKLQTGKVTRRFAVSSGMGFDADICHAAAHSRWKVLLNKLGLGKLSYIAIALNRLIFSKPFPLTLQTEDGNERFFPRTYFVAFLNSPSEGGGIRFCPNATNLDHRLDYIVVSDVSKLKILLVLPLAVLGRHTRIKGVTIGVCTAAHVSTLRALPIHTDGEQIPAGQKLSVSRCAQRLRIITNTNFN